jgi:molybdate transport repressor ModE-like protein
LRILFQNSIHVFEDLDKEVMVSREKGGRIGGRGTIEHHGKEYIEEYQR